MTKPIEPQVLPIFFTKNIKTIGPEINPKINKIFVALSCDFVSVLLTIPLTPASRPVDTKKTGRHANRNNTWSSKCFANGTFDGRRKMCSGVDLTDETQ